MRNVSRNILVKYQGEIYKVIDVDYSIVIIKNILTNQIKTVNRSMLNSV